MSDPLWERLLVAATGPTVAAVLGTLLVGLFLATRGAKEADRREQAADRRQFEFRQGLVDAMVRAVVPLEMACKTYSGRQVQSQGDSTVSGEIARDLDVLYLAFRTDCGSLGRRLRAHYIEPELLLKWHAIEDLLTVRYFQLRGLETERFMQSNAGPEHSGLEVHELRDVRLLHEAVEAALDRTADLVVTGELNLPA